jgi:uncharacterized protein (UPF0212 family)
MNSQKVQKVVTELNRTLQAARDVQDAAKADDAVFICGSKATGRLRRASLDLTRALAEMRRAS